jgi:hypothetical protein
MCVSGVSKGGRDLENSRAVNSIAEGVAPYGVEPNPKLSDSLLEVLFFFIDRASTFHGFKRFRVDFGSDLGTHGLSFLWISI